MQVKTARRARSCSVWVKFKELSLLTAQGSKFCVRGKAYRALASRVSFDVWCRDLGNKGGISKKFES